MIDTHCHLDDPRYDADREAVLVRARAAGVEGVLIPGLRAAQWPRVRALAASAGGRFALGTHPCCLADLGVDEPVLPADVTGARAIGECGLDGGAAAPLERQEAVLEAHLALARDTGLPVVLHAWRAHHRLLPLLRRWAPVRGVMHAYSGGPDLVDAYVALGLHLSFAGAITWPRARRPVAALRRVPRDRLLVETDGPDQCPSPHRGRSEPAWLPDIVAAMERHRGEPLREQLAANAAALGW